MAMPVPMQKAFQVTDGNVIVLQGDNQDVALGKDSRLVRIDNDVDAGPVTQQHVAQSPNTMVAATAGELADRRPGNY